MPSGGDHPPVNPAAVSGPGALSQRTDGKQPVMALPNAKYGENKDFQAVESGAPMGSPPRLTYSGAWWHACGDARRVWCANGQP